MDYGRYFKRDADASAIGRGLVIFRYRPDGETDSPVYVAITGQSIDFDVVGEKTNARVLRIPLEENLERSLATTLAEAFNRSVLIPELAAYEVSRADGGDHRGYFATFFKREKNAKQSGHPWNLWASDKTTLPLAKLILDFLFDLQENRIFQMSPHYGELTKKLREDFFFRCLAAKAGYLYQRTLFGVALMARAQVVGENGTRERNARKLFYGELLFEAEKEWTVCIRDPRSDKTFHNANGWFGDSETEIKRVYSPWVSMRLDKEHREEKRENDRLVSKWLIARYSGLTAWRIFLCGHGSFFGVHLFWPRIVLSIATAWFTLALVEGTDPSQKLPTESSVAAIIVLLLIMILSVSLLAIRRNAPLARDILWRALRLTGLVVSISSILGSVLLIAVGIESRMSYHDYLFYWIAAAFIGLVLQIFLQGDNPSESL